MLFICFKVFQNLAQSKLIDLTLSFYNKPGGVSRQNIITKTMKRNLINLTLCTLIVCMTTSCASIFCGTKAKVTFDSNIKQCATLSIDGIKHHDVTFPYTTKVARGFDDTIVKAEAKDYKTETIVIDKKFNPVSIINLTDILGWGIDAATGAITKPAQKVYEIEFKKESKE